jgi:hypothetical protein
LTNQLQKLKTTSSFKKKLDAARGIILDYLKFIAKNAAGLRFSKLFELRIVRFFYTAGLCKRPTHQGCAKVGLIQKSTSSNRGWASIWGNCAAMPGNEGLSKFFRKNLFFENFDKPFFVFKSKI